MRIVAARIAAQSGKPVNGSVALPTAFVVASTPESVSPLAVAATAVPEPLPGSCADGDDGTDGVAGGSCGVTTTTGGSGVDGTCVGGR